MSRKQSKRRREAVRTERAAISRAAVAARAAEAPRAAARAESRETRAWATALVAGLAALIPEEAIRRLLREEQEANREAREAARLAEEEAASRRGRIGAAAKKAKVAAATLAAADEAAEAAVREVEAARLDLSRIGASALIYTRSGAERYDRAAERVKGLEEAARTAVAASDKAAEEAEAAIRAVDAVRLEGARALSRVRRLAARAAATTIRRKEAEEERARLLPIARSAAADWEKATARVAFSPDAVSEVEAAEAALAAWGRLAALRDGPAKAIEGLCNGTAKAELEATVRRLQREATRSLGRGSLPGYRQEEAWVRGLRPLDRGNRA